MSDFDQPTDEELDTKREGMEFTEREFIASDPMYSEGIGANIVLANVAFSVSHDHDSQSITVVQRFRRSTVDEEGFSEGKAQQISMTIPLGQLEMAMTMMMEEASCVIAVAMEERGNN